MELTQLKVSNFRNITQATLELHPALNFIIGDNASGKTSLLEAIYSLGRGRSFKTANSDKLIQRGKSAFTVTSSVDVDGKKLHLGIHRANKKTRIRFSGQSIQKASHLSDILPLQIIEPGLHSFFEQGPEVRRRFLEWGVFHVEPRYEPAWRTFRRVLLQRNAALKSRWQQPEVKEWDSLLVESAAEIDEMRRLYLDQIISFLNVFSEKHAIDFLRDIDIEYHQGWKRGLQLDEALAATFGADQDRGFTQCGPHRADIRIKIGKDYGKDILSRGQQKLFINLLFVAQSILLRDVSGKCPLILIDDLAAELDISSKAVLKDVLVSTDCQTFITATSMAVFGVDVSGLSHAVFHVEHGDIQQMV